MELLQELLNINIASETLFEDFGNLKQIDKGLVKALMKNVYYGSDQFGNSKYKDILNKKVGQNSKTEDVKIKNSKTIIDAFNTDKSVQAAVIFDKNSGKQFGMVGVLPSDRSYSDNMKIIFNSLALAGQSPSGSDVTRTQDYIHAEMSKLSKEDGGYLSFMFNTFDDHKVMKMFNVIKKITSTWVKNDVNIDLYAKFVYSDSDRTKTNSNRALAKRGAIPVKLKGQDLEDFKKRALASLENRLENYKKSKIKNKATVDIKNFAEAVKEQGFLDHFSVGGFIYDYFDQTIRFDKLRKGEHKTPGSWDKSYIEYRVDDNEPEYEKLREIYWKKRSEIAAAHKDDPEGYKMENEKLKKRLKFPPSRIRVLLDLDKGTIVPYDIEVDFST